MSVKRQVKLLFPVVLYQSEVSVSNDELISLKSENFFRNTCNNAWITPTDIHKSYKSLISEIDRHVDFYCKEVLKMTQDTTMSCCGAWVNKHDKKDFAQRHYHSNSMISGVLYLDVPEQSGGIEFLPHMNMFGHFFEPKFVEDNGLNHPYQNIDVKNNMLLLFPSTVQHSVPLNKSEESRYTFAFDYVPTGRIISGENEITITV